jgi:hypothetical protein
MSGVNCPVVDQTRVKQVQDAVKILFENKGPEDENYSIGNLLGCISGDLSHALSPLEDLEAADTSIPNNVDEETVATTQSIFSEMFRENIGNSENEKEFVSFAMKMVFAITNHLENSSGNQFKTDPRVEELNGGMPKTNNVAPAPAPAPERESVLANETGNYITSVLIYNGFKVGALLTDNLSDQEKILKDYLLPSQESLINASITTGNVAKIPVKYLDLNVKKPLSNKITETKHRAMGYVNDRINSIKASRWYLVAFHIVMTIFTIWFFHYSFRTYILGTRNNFYLLKDTIEAYAGLGTSTFMVELMKTIFTYVPSITSKAAAICDINFDGYENTFDTIMKNAGPGLYVTYQCVKNVKIQETETPFARDVLQSSVAFPYAYMYLIPGINNYLIRPGIYKIYEYFFKKKELQEQEQSAGKSKSRRRRKSKMGKKKTRKNHKKKTRKAGKRKGKKKTRAAKKR